MGLEATTIAGVYCKTSFMRESLVTCNALWEQFKVVDGKSLYIHKLSHKELLYKLRNESGKILYLCILIPQFKYIRMCHWETIFWFCFYKIVVTTWYRKQYIVTVKS